jgi:hypothetical protein
VYDVEQAGLSRLADLSTQESIAIQKAISAKNSDDYKALADYTNTVRNIQNDRLNTLTKMTEQIKTIEDTDKNLRNMNTNEANIMNAMISSYMMTSKDMPANETEAYYEKKSKELSEIM